MAPFILVTQNDKLRGRAAYFVRIAQKAVTDKTVEQDIAAGQISGTALDAFRTLLTDLFVPVLKEQGNWGKSAEEYVSEFMQVREKGPPLPPRGRASAFREAPPAPSVELESAALPAHASRACPWRLQTNPQEG